MLARFICLLSAVHCSVRAVASQFMRYGTCGVEVYENLFSKSLDEKDANQAFSDDHWSNTFLARAPLAEVTRFQTMQFFVESIATS